MVKQKWYVVFVGTKPGVYTEWEEASTYVEGVPRATHKSYATDVDARRAYRAAYRAGRVRVIQTRPGIRYEAQLPMPDSDDEEEPENPPPAAAGPRPVRRDATWPPAGPANRDAQGVVHAPPLRRDATWPAGTATANSSRNVSDSSSAPTTNVTYEVTNSLRAVRGGLAPPSEHVAPSPATGVTYDVTDSLRHVAVAGGTTVPIRVWPASSTASDVANASPSNNLNGSSSQTQARTLSPPTTGVTHDITRSLHAVSRPQTPTRSSPLPAARTSNSQRTDDGGLFWTTPTRSSSSPDTALTQRHGASGLPSTRSRRVQTLPLPVHPEPQKDMRSTGVMTSVRTGPVPLPRATRTIGIQVNTGGASPGPRSPAPSSVSPSSVSSGRTSRLTSPSVSSYGTPPDDMFIPRKAKGKARAMTPSTPSLAYTPSVSQYEGFNTEPNSPAERVPRHLRQDPSVAGPSNLRHAPSEYAQEQVQEQEDDPLVTLVLPLSALQDLVQRKTGCSEARIVRVSTPQHRARQVQSQPCTPSRSRVARSPRNATAGSVMDTLGLYQPAAAYDTVYDPRSPVVHPNPMPLPSGSTTFGRPSPPSHPRASDAMSSISAILA